MNEPVNVNIRKGENSSFRKNTIDTSKKTNNLSSISNKPRSSSKKGKSSKKTVKFTEPIEDIVIIESFKKYNATNTHADPNEAEKTPCKCFIL